jgi:hypothetical protein
MTYTANVGREPNTFAITVAFQQWLKYGVPHQRAVLGPEKSQIERVGAHTE